MAIVLGQRCIVSNLFNCILRRLDNPQHLKSSMADDIEFCLYQRCGGAIEDYARVQGMDYITRAQDIAIYLERYGTTYTLSEILRFVRGEPWDEDVLPPDHPVSFYQTELDTEIKKLETSDDNDIVELGTEDDDDEEEGHVCRSCHSKRVRIDAVQTRSADEPPTVTITCRECGFHWRLSN